MKIEKNYKEFDFQTILVKKEKVDDVKNKYNDFGWEVNEIKQHHQFENILEIEFVRNHFIKNKDELQLLQVYLDHDINLLGKLEKNKHSKTTIWGIVLGLIGGVFCTASVMSFIKLEMYLSIIFGVLFALFAISIFVVMTIVLLRLAKKEKVVYNTKVQICQNNIEQYCQKAKLLVGENDEKEND